MGKPQPHISNIPTSIRSPPAPPLPSIPNTIKTCPRFPTWCWEHLRVRFLQQLHGELGVVSAQLEDKATKRKSSVSLQRWRFSGQVPPAWLLGAHPTGAVGLSTSSWAAEAPGSLGIVLCLERPALFDWCPSPRRVFLPARWKTRESWTTFPRNTWISAGCGSPAPHPKVV